MACFMLFVLAIHGERSLVVAATGKGKHRAPLEEVTMRTSILLVLATSSVLLACGGSYPAPVQHMADTQSAERSAVELGAANQPKAQLHLRLAQEQMAQAKAAMSEGDNARADALLVRAKADAELAIALSRQENAKIAVKTAVDQANAQRSTNASQGAKP
jgi:Domain of unknown function (DUF4398)